MDSMWLEIKCHKSTAMSQTHFYSELCWLTHWTVLITAGAQLFHFILYNLHCVYDQMNSYTQCTALN